MQDSIMVCWDFFFSSIRIMLKTVTYTVTKLNILLLPWYWLWSILQFPLVYHKQHHSVSIWASVCLPVIGEVAKGEKENCGWRQCKLGADVVQGCSKLCPTHPVQGEAPWAQAAVLSLQSSPPPGCRVSLVSAHQGHVFSCS